MFDWCVGFGLVLVVDVVEWILFVDDEVELVIGIDGCFVGVVDDDCCVFLWQIVEIVVIEIVGVLSFYYLCVLVVCDVVLVECEGEFVVVMFFDYQMLVVVIVCYFVFCVGCGEEIVFGVVGVVDQVQVCVWIFGMWFVYGDDVVCYIVFDDQLLFIVVDQVVQLFGCIVLESDGVVCCIYDCCQWGDVIYGCWKQLVQVVIVGYVLVVVFVVQDQLFGCVDRGCIGFCLWQDGQLFVGQVQLDEMMVW